MGTQLVRKVFYTDCSWTAPAGVGTVTITAVAPPVKQLGTGNLTSVIVTSNGSGVSLGSNACGKLGIGSITPACLPTPISCGLRWKSLTMNGGSADHVVGLTTDGVGYAWGDNGSGKLGIGSITPACLPTPICCNFKWRMLVGGGSISAGITKDGDMYAWGSGSAGRLGNGTTTAVCVPSLVCCGLKWEYLTHYNAGMLGITTSGDAYAWGDGSWGALGNGSTGDRCVPTPVCCGLKWKFLSGGGAPLGTVFGITCSGDLYGWGSNECGKVGDGTITQRNAPRIICSGTKWKYVSSGASHSVGVTCSGDGFAWGNLACGSGGTNSIAAVCVPTPICCNFKWIAIEAGDTFSVGITENGEAYAWGNNNCGVLGNGSTTVRCLPTLVCCRNSYSWTLPDVSQSFSVTPGQSYCLSLMAKTTSFNYEPVGDLSEAFILEYYQSNSA